MSLRELLKANMFDGDENGEITMGAKTLLDSVEELARPFIAEKVAAAAHPHRPLVELPSGTVLNIERLSFISRKEINQYVAFFPEMTQAALISGTDLDALRMYGVIQRLELPTPIEPPLEALPKIEVAK